MDVQNISKYQGPEDFEFRPHDKYSMFTPSIKVRDSRSEKAREKFKQQSILQQERKQNNMIMSKKDIIDEYQSEGDSRHHIADLAEKNNVSKQDMRRYLREECKLEVYEPLGRQPKQKEKADANILDEIKKKQETLEGIPAAVEEDEKLPDLPEEVFEVIHKNIEQNKERIAALLEETQALKQKNIELIRFIAKYKGVYKNED